MADWQAAQGKIFLLKNFCCCLLLFSCLLACLLAVYGKIIPRELNFFYKYISSQFFFFFSSALPCLLYILLLLFCYLIMMRAASGRRNKKIQQAKDKNRTKIKRIKEEKWNYISVGWKWRRTMECRFAVSICSVRYQSISGSKKKKKH